jgi:hypothetical protein
LEKHLALLRRQGIVDEWHDRKIDAGSEWAGQISDHLERADVILLLISSDFLASDYCFEIEMKRALERHEAREARVIPVILRPCDWHSAPFGRLQALPRNAKPITAWTDQDQAFTEVARGLRSIATGEAVPGPAPQPGHAESPTGGRRVVHNVSDRSVSFGGSVTGSAIVTGDNNTTSLQFTQTTLPPAETIDIRAELAAVRDLLRQLRSETSKKIDRAMEDALDEIKKPEPDRDEVGDALHRALKYAKQAEGFADTTSNLKQHVTNAVSWLGDDWRKLLSLVGLTL